jgi:hypothetical protein
MYNNVCLLVLEDHMILLIHPRFDIIHCFFSYFLNLVIQNLYISGIIFLLWFDLIECVGVLFSKCESWASDRVLSCQAAHVDSTDVPQCFITWCQVADILMSLFATSNTENWNNFFLWHLVELVSVIRRVYLSELYTGISR